MDAFASHLPLLEEIERATTAPDLFPALVLGLVRCLRATRVLLAEHLPLGRGRVLAFYEGGSMSSEAVGTEWDLAQGVFPFGAIDAEVHLPLQEQGRTLGHLALCGGRVQDAATTALLRIFAARASAQLFRIHVERTLSESEERLRDLFDEAPIAYVHEGLDSRFIRANRTAMRILGITPEEVPHTIGKNFVPDTEDAQRRVKEALDSIGRGIDTSGLVLELRRKDNGKPIFIEWWSRPDPSGTYTRTMFIDITERILMEKEQERLKAQNLYLREEIKAVHNCEEIIGRSPGLIKVLADVKRVAPTDATVLITGETGTGKELIARYIHQTSKRYDKPLIKLNCAALPLSLVESELFGHEKGAFSGALTKRQGRFELAHGGTLFLDEVGELPLEVQAKLLRVLQEREFERVGGNVTHKVDVRVIAATNRDLKRAVAQGKFREDLFYRLNVFPTHLPPLRERQEDIRLLVRFFLGKFGPRVGKQVTSASEETIGRFLSYGWPGNIRELANFVERAVILSDGDVLEADPLPLSSSAPFSEGRREGFAQSPQSLEEHERDHIHSTLVSTNWVIEGSSGAAQILGLHPNTLRSRMKKLGIRRPS